jgi:hypothetical protein
VNPSCWSSALPRAWRTADAVCTDGNETYLTEAIYQSPGVVEPPYRHAHTVEPVRLQRRNIEEPV